MSGVQMHCQGLKAVLFKRCGRGYLQWKVAKSDAGRLRA